MDEAPRVLSRTIDGERQSVEAKTTSGRVLPAGLLGRNHTLAPIQQIWTRKSSVAPRRPSNGPERGTSDTDL